MGSVVYGTEAGIFRKTLGVPTVVCGPGDIAQAHQPNEYLLASQIDACEGLHAAHGGVGLRLGRDSVRQPDRGRLASLE